jgi:uncharacterized protein
MNDSGITVTAIGTASGPPDRAVLTLGASAIRGEVATALAAVNDKIEKLISTMAGYGIEGADIQTSDLWIQPEHNEERALAGFRVRNTVRITITAMDAVGEIIAAAAAVLGDLAEIHGINFDVSDPAPLEAQARVRAWSRAHEKARQLAELSGTRLGQAVEVNETSTREQGPGPSYPDLGLYRAVPVETGEASVDVHLKVRFAQFPDDNTSG